MRPRKGLMAVLMVALAVFACLILAEIILRVAVDPSRVWRNAWFIPWLSERYYQEKFLAHYNSVKRPGTEAMEALIGWNAELGWDNVDQGRIRPPAAPQISKGPDTRIVFIGDSFAWANEVADDKAFHYLLGRRTGIESFSMGASGYGIDQAVMKYQHHVRPYKPDILVLVVHPPDYERSTLSFGSAAKPRYRLDPGRRLMIENRPVPTVAEQLRTLDSRHAWWPWSLGFLASHAALLPGIRGWLEGLWLEEWDQILGTALAGLRDDLAAEGGELMVVQIPAGHAYVDRPGVWNDLNEAKHLRGIYDGLGISWLDLGEELPKLMPPAEIADRLYTRSRDGSYGHLNEEGNRLLAGMLLDVLCGRKVGHGPRHRPTHCQLSDP